MGLPAEILPMSDQSSVSLIKFPVNTDVIISSEINVLNKPNSKINPSKTGIEVLKPLSALENADNILLSFIFFYTSLNNLANEFPGAL